MSDDVIYDKNWNYALPFTHVRQTGWVCWRPWATPTPRWHVGADMVPLFSSDSWNITASTNGTVVAVGYTAAYGNYICINDEYRHQQTYMHIANSSIPNTIYYGAPVTRGDFLGRMGNTGPSGMSAHLHFQVINDTDEYSMITPGYTQQERDKKVLNPWKLLYPKEETMWHTEDFEAYGSAETESSAYIGASSGKSVYSASVSKSGDLLSPSDDERKYGVSVYSGMQELIKPSTSLGVAGSNSIIQALQAYAKYVYYYNNSRVSTANVQTVALPQIRPGYNVWVDPKYIDNIYYVDTVTHQGSTTGGVYTTLQLSFGRDRKKFTNGSGFGSLRPSSTDNMFVNNINIGTGEFFNTVLNTSSSFNTVKTKIDNYYSQEETGDVRAENNELLKYLYKDGSKSSSKESSLGNGNIMGGEFESVDAIQSKLTSIYSKAPDVIQERSAKIKKVVSEADNFIKTHYGTK